jgi:hypothetical protein
VIKYRLTKWISSASLSFSSRRPELKLLRTRASISNPTTTAYIGSRKNAARVVTKRDTEPPQFKVAYATIALDNTNMANFTDTFAYSILSLAMIYLVFPALSLVLIPLALQRNKSHILYSVLFSTGLLLLAGFVLAGTIDLESPNTFMIWPFELGVVAMMVSVIVVLAGKVRSAVAKGAVVLVATLLIAFLLADFVRGPAPVLYAGRGRILEWNSR